VGEVELAAGEELNVQIFGVPLAGADDERPVTTAGDVDVSVDVHLARSPHRLELRLPPHVAARLQSLVRVDAHLDAAP
jgi:hypothetical protein